MATYLEPLLKSIAERARPYLDIFLLLALVIGVGSGVLIVELQKHVVVILGLVGLIAFIFTILSPEFGLALLIFLTYTRLSDIAVQDYGAPSVAKFFIALLAGTIFMRWALFHEPPKGWQRPSLLVGLYGLIGLGSVIYAPETSKVIEDLSNFIKDALITVVVVIMLTKTSSFRISLWTLMFVGIFLGSISVWQYLTGTFQNNYWGFAEASIQNIVGDSNDYRIAGPISDPNFYAQIMAVITFIALERTLHEKNIWLRLLALWSLGASGFSVVLTYSRGGFLALIVALIAFMYVYRPKVYHVPLIILALIAVFVVAPKNYVERIFSLQEFFSTPGSLRTEDMALRGRASANITAYEMIRSNPLFGVGLNNYENSFGQYSRLSGLAMETETAAHNLYLEVAAETGLVGLTVFMAMVIVSARTILQARKRFLAAGQADMVDLITGFGSGFFAYMFAAIFIHGAYPRYFYLLIGIALALDLVSRQAVKKKILMPSSSRSPLSNELNVAPFARGER